MEPVTNLCAGKPMQCDRKTAFVLFSAIKKKVQKALLAIHDVINRSQALKHYPYPTFYKKTLTKDYMTSSNSDSHLASCDAPENRPSPATVPVKEIRNTIDERMSETLTNIQFEQEAANLDLVRMIVDACLRYQIAVRNLVELMRYLSDSFNRFYKTHLEYDEILQALQCDPADRAENKDTDPLVAESQEISSLSGVPSVERISEVQNNLEITKETLQKFLNQVPSQLGKLRIEMDLINIYDVDDTAKVHRFLDSQYVKSLIAQSTSADLKRACRLIRSSWRELLPIDMVTPENPRLNSG